VDFERDYFKLYVYTSLEMEKLQHLDYLQWKFRTSPSLGWDLGRLSLGISGAGYEFQDEIGIEFDNRELIAYKKADRYSAWVLAVKGFAFYDLNPSLRAGLESGYRGGSWEQGGEDGLLEEYVFISSLEVHLGAGPRWDLSVKGSLELYQFHHVIPVEKELPSERVFRISVILSR
jgi:hypothetical protein